MLQADLPVSVVISISTQLLTSTIRDIGSNTKPLAMSVTS
jgi:hypothetical protein